MDFAQTDKWQHTMADLQRHLIMWLTIYLWHLYYFACRTSLLLFIKFFLCKRRQRMRYRSETSNWLPKRDMHQPVVFLAVINILLLLKNKTVYAITVATEFQDNPLQHKITTTNLQWEELS